MNHINHTNDITYQVAKNKNKSSINKANFIAVITTIIFEDPKRWRQFFIINDYVKAYVRNCKNFWWKPVLQLQYWDSLIPVTCKCKLIFFLVEINGELKKYPFQLQHKKVGISVGIANFFFFFLIVRLH